MSTESDTLAAQRTDYYSKWDKFTKEEVEAVEQQDKTEADEASQKLGLNSDAPKSEVEKKDLEKRQALREAKQLWKEKELSEQMVKKIIGDGDDGENLVVDEVLLEGKSVVFIQNSKNSCYRLPSNLTYRLTKVFIENCENCTIDIECMCITQHLEISHSENLTINIRVETKVVQLDLCTNITLNYDPAVFHEKEDKIYTAGVSNSTFNVVRKSGKTFTVKVDYKELGAEIVGDKPLEEFQFVSHFYKEEFLTERIYRSKGNLPLTNREIVEAEAAGNGDGLQSQERAAELKKIGGNEAFQEGNYHQAAVFYTESIDLAPAGSKLIPICYANRAQCYLKTGHLYEALIDSDECITVDPSYVKGHFRRGMALHALKRYPEAIMSLSHASDMEPKNEQIKQALGFAHLKHRKSMAA